MSGTAVVAHGGGPTPVLNASLAGLIAEAAKHPIGRLLGAHFGVQGLVEGRYHDLFAIGPGLLDAIRQAPGSAIGTSRRPLTPEDDRRILDDFRRRDVRWFFYTGGNGSMETALRFDRLARESGYELQVVGIPKTIDNDLAGTDHSPGYGSSARFYAHAVRDIGEDNRSLPWPVCFVETLGRNVGWVVASTAHACHNDEYAPHLIYFPECGVSIDKICADVEAVVARLGRCVVAVCEGQADQDGRWFNTELTTAPGARGGVPVNTGHVLARLVWDRTGLRARSEKPGLLGRCSAPFVSEVDRDEAWRCGQAAVRAAMRGESGQMISLRRAPGHRYEAEPGLTPLAEVAGVARPFPLDWINDSRNHVRPEYLEWSRPLVGEISRHPALSAPTT
ncbi:MAG: diphosphate--fructose-6-phosphate 1-phosphotransferase [Acidobacteria bacterium]|nr:diphosphate--fructose-6-phosphate 1-phosphotransferase [Acidobacteriota bacterium]